MGDAASTEVERAKDLQVVPLVVSECGQMSMTVTSVTVSLIVTDHSRPAARRAVDTA
jgi:hypothetical protein